MPNDPSAHTSWVDLLDETAHERELRLKESDDEYTIERIIRRRWNSTGTAYEYLVKWEWYDDKDDRTWVPHPELVATDALAAFAAHAQIGGINEEDEEPAAKAERRMMYRIFNGLQNDAVPRNTTDSVFSVLADAEPIGNGRCFKTGPTKGICDLCHWLCKHQTAETSHHVGSDCPCNMLAQEVVLRAALHASLVDENERERIAKLNWRELL